jgi:hypothetical protein
MACVVTWRWFLEIRMTAVGHHGRWENVITTGEKRRAKKGSLIRLGIQSNLTFSVIASFQIRVVPTAYGVDLSDVFAVP